MSSDGDSEEHNESSKDAIAETFSSSFGDILRVSSTDSALQQALVVESSTPMLSPMQSQDENDFDDDILKLDSNNEQILRSDEGTEILILPKPPNQDIDVVQKKDKTLSQLLQTTAVEVHSKFGHLFHDKAYRIRSSIVHVGTNEKAFEQSGTSTSKNQLLAKTSSVLASSMPQLQLAEKQQLAKVDASSEVEAKRDICDKLLRSGKYSSSNVFVGKLALIVQPLVEIVQMFLATFRASFNIMTWRDPFLSFWIVIFGILLVPILHMFPWRIVLGVVGLVFVGPQNYVYRVIMDYFQGSQEENLDVVVRKKRQDDDDDENDEDAPIFSNKAPDNRPLRPAGMSASQDIKEVAVPQSQLMYRRCYDWPPEPEYARVTIVAPPKSNPEAERLLEGNQIETYGTAHIESNSDHQTKDISGSIGGRRWARRIVNRSVASVKTVPTRLRGGRKKDA
jgi:hypothetical protein